MMEQPKSYLKLGIAVLILIFLVIISSLIIPRKQSSPLIVPGFFQGINLTSTFSFAFKSEDLSKIIQKNLDGKKGEPASPAFGVASPLASRSERGEYAVYIEDLSDAENYSLRALDIFPAASLYKVFLMAAVLKEVEKSSSVIPANTGIQLNTSSSKLDPRSSSLSLRAEGLRGDDKKGLTMETKISAKKSYLVERFGGVDFGYEDIPDDDIIEYTVEEALTRVGRISDNFAAIMLMDKVGPNKVQAIVDSTGATSTSIKSPITTSAQDIGNFFKALYKMEVVNEAVSAKLIEFLSLNQLNNRIPAFAEASAGKPALEGVRIIHKTGELPGVRHDAGLVWFTPGESVPATPGVGSLVPSVVEGDSPGVDQRAYVIVLMSKDLKYEDEAVETLAKISKDVYEYFRNKNVKN